MSEDYDPFKYQGSTPVQRQEGYEEETEEICQYILKERGDQRIGQYLINALQFSGRWDEQADEDASKEENLSTILWDIEAPELLRAIEEFEDRGENQQ
jgi:serine protease inhibitor